MAQTELWHAQLLEPASTIYNIGGYVEIDGPLDRAAFERALRQVIDEADSHHLIFLNTPIGLHQQMSRSDADIPFVDVSTADEPQAAAVRWMKAAMAEPFDLYNGPLYRHALLKIADHRHAWFAAVHHLVSDAFGMSLFVRRVGEAYGARLGAPERPATATPWRDYLRDEINYRDSGAYQKDADYWRDQLKSHPDAATFSGKALARPSELITSIGQRFPLVGEAPRTGGRGDKFHAGRGHPCGGGVPFSHASADSGTSSWAFPCPAAPVLPCVESTDFYPTCAAAARRRSLCALHRPGEASPRTGTAGFAASTVSRRFPAPRLEVGCRCAEPVRYRRQFSAGGRRDRLPGRARPSTHVRPGESRGGRARDPSCEWRQSYARAVRRQPRAL